ncbi:MAG: aromatic ring-hydroxylating dioxygenase subunit alpha [Halioglobus sp.]
MMDHALQIDILKELLQQLDEGKNIDSGVQYKMSTDVYVCPDIAAQERDQFFQNHPQLIGMTGDLPEADSFFTIDNFGTPILATRDRQGNFRAFLNACRHRGVRVASEERGKKALFVCPFHAWSYSSSGDLIAITDEDHFGALEKSCLGLIELPAVESGGLLWIHPQPDGSLNVDSLLGDLTSELADFNFEDYVYGGSKTITMNLNWKLANDTFGETYHFGKLHKNTLAKINQGNNLHLHEFGRNHRFVTASRAIDEMRQLPTEQWDILVGGAFVLYYLFPNITLIVTAGSCILVRMYPDPENPGRSTTQIGAYYTREAMEAAAQDQPDVEKITPDNVYEQRQGRVQTLAGTMEVFSSTVEHEDYLMGEYQQKSAESGLLKEVIFGRNEPPLHHFHKTFREVLGLSPLEKLG